MKPKKMMKINLDSGKPVVSEAIGAKMAKKSVMANFGQTPQFLINFIGQPIAKARTSPTTIYTPTSPSSTATLGFSSSSPPGAELKAMVRKTEKMEMAIMSSKLAAAIRDVGMPFLVP